MSQKNLRFSAVLLSIFGIIFYSPIAVPALSLVCWFVFKDMTSLNEKIFSPVIKRVVEDTSIFICFILAIFSLFEFLGVINYICQKVIYLININFFIPYKPLSYISMPIISGELPNTILGLISYSFSDPPMSILIVFWTIIVVFHSVVLLSSRYKDLSRKQKKQITHEKYYKKLYRKNTIFFLVYTAVVLLIIFPCFGTYEIIHQDKIKMVSYFDREEKTFDIMELVGVEQYIWGSKKDYIGYRLVFRDGVQLEIDPPSIEAVTYLLSFSHVYSNVEVKGNKLYLKSNKFL